MRKLFLLLVFTLLLTACTEPVQPDDGGNEPSDVSVEDTDENFRAEDDSEESTEPEYEEIKFSEEYISPYQVLTEADALEITGGKLYNYSPLDKSEDEKAYITPTGKLVYITDYNYQEMCRTESGIPSVFDYEMIGPTDFDVNFVDKVRVNVDPNEKLGYEPVGIKIYDYRENQEYIKVVASNFEANQIWYELHAESYQIKDENSDSFSYMIGCYGIAKSGSVLFDLGFQAQSDDFVLSDVIFNDDDWAFANTAFMCDSSFYTSITTVSLSMSNDDHLAKEYRFLARVWDDESQLVHYELISVKITREYNDIVLTVTNYEDEIDPLYLGEDYPGMSDFSDPDIIVEPAPAEPVPEEPVEEPVEPAVEPVPESVLLSGAALGSVDMTDYGDEYRYMSSDEAQTLTGGKLYRSEAHCNEYFDAYITPSGKLVRMYPSDYECLPEGTVDFAVDWHHPENSAAPVNFRVLDYRMSDGVISLDVSNLNISDVKYDLYVSLIMSMDAYSPVDSFGCYGVATEGTVSYDYGFKVNSEDYKGMTLKCTVTDPDGNVNVYSGSTDGVVSVASRVRDVSSTDWLTWNVVAEIVDADGNTVYTESFMYKEYEDFANSIEFAISMQ